MWRPGPSFFLCPAGSVEYVDRATASRLHTVQESKCMIRHRPPADVLEDLRYALQVMNEAGHLGLDDKYIESLRQTLFRGSPQSEP